MFFGKVFRWQPSEILALPWRHRKEVKQAYLDHLNEGGNK